jgi:hypothetical protein
VDGLHWVGSRHAGGETQTTVRSPAQTPFWQSSALVQALLSSHGVASGSVSFAH